MAIVKRVGGYRTTFKCNQYVWKDKACYAPLREKDFGNTPHVMMVYAIPHKVRGSHVTFFSYEETLEYMNEIMKLVGGKIISFHSDDDFYWCQVRLVNDQRYLLYVSTIVRYAFEDNFSLMTYCAFHNKELRKHLNLINAIQLYLGYFCVCGPRSALFTTFLNLGLIIIKCDSLQLKGILLKLDVIIEIFTFLGT